MPSYRKRGDTWRAEIMRHGRRESATFPTKREAQEWATRREAELTAVRTGKVIRKSLGDVMQKYADEVSPGKAGKRWEQTRIAAMGRDPLAEMVMQDIGPADLAEWRDRRLRGDEGTPAVKGSTVLRDIALLRAIWRRAKMGEWRFVDHDPWPEVEKPADSRARTATFQPGQAERIVEALGYQGGTPADKRQPRWKSSALSAVARSSATPLSRSCRPPTPLVAPGAGSIRLLGSCDRKAENRRRNSLADRFGSRFKPGK